MDSLRNESRLALVSACMAYALTTTLDHCIAEERQSARVTGSDAHVSFVRQDSKLLLNANEVATAFGWEAKVVADGQMLTLCRDGDNGLCIPVRLPNVTSLQSDTALFVDAKALARPLRFRVLDLGGIVTLAPVAGAAIDNQEIPAYNASWGKGRGFRPGQTLPDIPLMDLQGREVRFCRYLGKQYIIYCWASW